jgi:FO synthase
VIDEVNAATAGNEDLHVLARTVYADPAQAMEQAADIRDRHFGPRVTYSRKVFIPLTKLCRDNCGYCTFAHPPRPGESAYLTPEEVLGIARAGADAGCKEALFTLGDKPEKRYPEARRELEAMGFGSTVEYLVYVCGLVLEETGLLPHANPGVLSAEEIGDLRRVAVSQGIMLEQSSDRLLGPDMAHWASPDKVPTRRLGTIEAAGRLRVPFTTGILIGIGETIEERVDTLLSIREAHERYGHVHECIVQNFRAKPGTRMALWPEPSEEEMLATIALARLILPPGMTVQAPPNLAEDEQDGIPSYARYIDAGINDWGGVSPVTPDHVNPERPWPHLRELERATEGKGYLLLERLALHPTYARETERWVDEKLRARVWAGMDAEGFARVEGWAPGTTEEIPAKTVAESRGRRPSKVRPEFARALAGAGSGISRSTRSLCSSPRVARNSLSCVAWPMGSVARSTATRSPTSSTGTSTTPTSATSAAASAPSPRVLSP